VDGCEYVRLATDQMKLTMQANPFIALPGEVVGFIAQVSPTDCSGVRLDLGAFASNDGQVAGHIHTGRPVGGMNPSACVTDSNGQCRGTHPTGSFSGIDTLAAKDFTALAYAGVNIQVPDLVEVLEDPSYTLIGQTDTHPSNHWVTSKTRNTLELIATDYHAAFPHEEVLHINDCSLELGGQFDANADWELPHKAHRVGKSADIRQWSMGQSIYPDFIRIVQKRDPGAKVGVDCTPVCHWHIDFSQ
jgi:hypothetical protein